MSIDYAAAYSALYSRAESDSAGSTLRALLGAFPSPFPKDTDRAGDKAVFAADKLKLYAGAGVVLPWLVWRAGTTNGQSGEMRDVGASWWAYNAPAKGDKVLYDIASALEALYGTQSVFAIAGGRLAVTFVGSPRVDQALGGLNGLEVRIGFRRL